MADVTASKLCIAALRKLGIVDPRNTPDTTLLASVFDEMKRMLKGWSIEVIYSNYNVHVLTDGQPSYSIGSGQDIDTTKPIAINDTSYVRSAGQDIILKIIGEKRYNQISQKTVGGTPPRFLWYLPGHTTGTIYLWPTGGGTLYLWSKKYLTDPTSITANTGFDDLYQDAIVWNLACRIAPDFNKDPTPFMISEADKSLGKVKDVNEVNEYPESEIDLSLMNRNNYNIDFDQG